MKKIFFMFIFAIILSGCGNSNAENTDTSGDADVESEENSDNEETEEAAEETNESEEKDIYQIGDTADIISSSYGFSYQVTLNHAELTTDPVDGVSLEDIGDSAEDGGEFLVANVTIKNTGDSPITPIEQLSAQLYDEEYPRFFSLDETFTERNDELAPGEEITGNLAYAHNSYEDNDVMYLTFEAEAIEEETRFEIPIPVE
ncbi:DUF4352 domain-containing protein [Oceanobacillus jeddahense]|uniref:DUF4352 domain-containing protein n=1 Tax=Oceanobacillus jeddahense TaxID=1462527 RepID=A0ABY5JV92_9BACI|nr:DUF4352 domain-containing protein [Oceanobacillus jeddahense]UUI04185.1 DUF4352 domain-containing protein [Oceanobacillus jeddahense]